MSSTLPPLPGMLQPKSEGLHGLNIAGNLEIGRRSGIMVVCPMSRLPALSQGCYSMKAKSLDLNISAKGREHKASPPSPPPPGMVQPQDEEYPWLKHH